MAYTKCLWCKKTVSITYYGAINKHRPEGGGGKNNPLCKSSGQTPLEMGREYWKRLID